jgi:hypothetical protein
MEPPKARKLPLEPPRGRGIPSAVFRYQQRHPLNAIFAPKTVAVVGATEKADRWDALSSGT